MTNARKYSLVGFFIPFVIGTIYISWKVIYTFNNELLGYFAILFIPFGAPIVLVISLFGYVIGYLIGTKKDGTSLKEKKNLVILIILFILIGYYIYLANYFFN